MSPEKKAPLKFGEFLIRRGWIKESDMLAALERQARYGERIGEAIVRLGLVEESSILESLAEFWEIPYIDLFTAQIDPSVLLLLPQDIAEKQRCIPFGRKFNEIQVAFAEPRNIDVTNAVEFALGTRIRPFLSRWDDIDFFLHRFYEVGERVGLHAIDLKKLVSDAQPLKSNELFSLSPTPKEADKTVARTIESALLKGQTEVRFATRGKQIRISAHSDKGSEILLRMDRVSEQGLFESVFRLSGLPTDQTTGFQQTGFKIDYGEERYIAVLTFSVSHLGPIASMRLVREAVNERTIEQLGMPPMLRQKMSDEKFLSNSTMLFVGPPFSGKSTSVNVALRPVVQKDRRSVMILGKEVTEKKNFVTINMAEEKRSQVQILTDEIKRKTRTIVVDPIKETEALSYILAQHEGAERTVLGTIRSATPDKFFNGLKETGINDYRIAQGLSLILFHRSIVPLCSMCKIPHPAPEAAMSLLGLNYSPGVTFYAAKGCPRCKLSGHRGRVILYEMIQLDDEIQNAIRDGADYMAIRKMASRKGFPTLLDQGFKYVLAGMLAPEDLLNLYSGTSLDDESPPRKEPSVETIQPPKEEKAPKEEEESEEELDTLEEEVPEAAVPQPIDEPTPEPTLLPSASQPVSLDANYLDSSELRMESKHSYYTTPEPEPSPTPQNFQFCSQCGSPMSEGLINCPNCGHAMYYPCSNCGAPVHEEWTHCPYCNMQNPLQNWGAVAVLDRGQTQQNPYATTSGGQANQNFSTEVGAYVHRVLVVDDDPRWRKALQDLLIQIGVEPITAVDGQQGVELAVALAPSIIVTDVEMPLLSGYDLVQTVRRTPQLAYIPIILLDDPHTAGQVVGPFLTANDDFLPKPFSKRAFIQKVGMMLNRFHSSR